MADDTEKVEYQYTGDVSSLRQATQQAISILDKYDSTIKKIASSDAFKASKTSATAFQKTIGSIIKQVNSLTTALNTSGSAIETAMPDSAATVRDAVQSLSDTLGYLNQSTTITSNDFKFLTEYLKTTKMEMDSVASRVSVLTSSLKSLEQLQVAQTMQDIGNATQETKKNFDSVATSGYRVQEAYVASGKSASESAAAFLKAERSATRMTNIQSVIRRLSTDIQLFGVYAANAWRSFSNYIDPTGTKLQSFKDKASEALGKVQSILAQVSSAFRRTSQEASDSGDPLKQLASKCTSLVSRFKNLTSSANKSTTSFAALTKVTNTLRGAVTALIGVNLGQWLAYAAKQSIAYTENLNLFSVAMGECVDQGNEFVNTMAELYGMDPSNLMRYAGNFYQLADAIDMPSQAAANLSLGLTKATNDIASLFNVDIETVFNDLSSGMQGMSRAVRKYGMDIRTTTLEQTALSLGITDQVENMSEANRQGLRFIAMMRQASNASGDFAKTIETPANQLRIFKEQISQLGRAIGDLFITPLATAIQYINGFVMALRMVISFIGSLFGAVSSFTSGVSGATDTADNLASSIGGIGSAASDTAKELKGILAPFDELNVLTEPSTGGAAGGAGGALGDIGTLDPAIEQAIEDMQWKLEEVRMKAVEVRDAILEFLGFKVEDGTILSWDASQFEENLINKFPKWTKTIQAIFDNLTNIVNGFKAVIKSLGDVAKAVWEKVTGFIGQFINDDTVSTFISNLADNLQNLATWISQNTDLLSNLVIAFMLFNKLSPVVTIIGNIVSYFFSLVGVIPQVIGAITSLSAPMVAIAAVIAVVAVALADLILTNEDFRDKIGDAWNSIVELIQDLWSNILEPIISRIGESLSTLYTDTIKPIVEQIATIILTFWSDILQPLISWLVTYLGPTISNLVDNILDIVDWMFNNIGGFISGLLQALQGVIDFIAGVFSGDWARAWQGIVDVFAGIFNSVATVVVAVINVVISAINGAISLIYNAVVSFINLILGAINTVASIIGQSFELRITAAAPQIPYISAPKVAMAQGGVVTGPTNALIGEGRYDEAVMPLGNSPQMREFADSVASRVNNEEQIALLREQNELLRQILEKTGVSIDGKKMTEWISSNQRNRARALGG